MWRGDPGAADDTRDILNRSIGGFSWATAREEEDFDFKEGLEEQNEKLETLNAEARELEERIALNGVGVLETT